MIVVTEGRNFILNAIKDEVFHAGLILGSVSLVTDTWLGKAWTETQEQIATVAADSTVGELVFDELTFTMSSDIKGFYLRSGNNLIYTESNLNTDVTELLITPEIKITNVL